MSENLVPVPRGAIGAVGDIIRIASDNPDARAAGVTAGKSLKILSETIHSVLLPLAVVNYGVRKFEGYMQSRFSDELADALGDIPPENVVEPPPMIVGPTLAALVYAHEEDGIRSLFLRLLASSMDRTHQGDAHPAFVEIIKQLDPREVQLLLSILRKGSIATVELRSASSNYQVLARHVVDLFDDEEGPQEEPQMGVYLTNWERLGLLEIDYRSSFADSAWYAYVEQRPEYARAVDRVAELSAEQRAGADESAENEQGAGAVLENAKPRVVNGRITVTPWGRQFARVIKAEDTVVELGGASV